MELKLSSLRMPLHDVGKQELRLMGDLVLYMLLSVLLVQQLLVFAQTLLTQLSNPFLNRNLQIALDLELSTIAGSHGDLLVMYQTVLHLFIEVPMRQIPLHLQVRQI